MKYRNLRSVIKPESWKQQQINQSQHTTRSIGLVHASISGSQFSGFLGRRPSIWLNHQPTDCPSFLCKLNYYLSAFTN